MNNYKIIRFYADGRRRKTIKENLTLEEAKKHCNREDTHKRGKWFDGYEEE